MDIFLSYAEEDKRVADQIYQLLDGGGRTVFNWLLPERRGGQFIPEIEGAIGRANCFIAVLSPAYLASRWCQEEWQYALRRDGDRSRPIRFIHVLLVAEVPPEKTGFIGNRDWRDLTHPDRIAAEVGELRKMLNPQEPESRGQEMPEASADSLAEPVFRNREQELEKILRGLTNAAGPHFWLVLGPPQLGKTWLLDRISKDEQLAMPQRWVISRVDLKEQPPEVLRNPAALLGLFRGSGPVQTDTDSLEQIAINVCMSRRPHLYILDSAELMDATAAGELRGYLSQIYKWVTEAPTGNNQFGLIVASRRNDGWKGLRGTARISVIDLTEFNLHIVELALRGMTERLSESEFENYANLAYGLTEGLPELVTRCLKWMTNRGFVGLNRMAEPGIFRLLAGEYIRDELLTSESLFPGRSDQSDDRLEALRYAYRLLAPYRLFTQSHLRNHQERDPGLTDILGRLGWSLTDMWRAITNTALLVQSSNEPFHRIHPAVRRLLYRYYYEFGETETGPRRDGAAAHREACRFVSHWAEGAPGEQVIGMIECLWHEARSMGAADPSALSSQLLDSARRLSEDLLPSHAYTLDELRENAVGRLRDDEEFQRAIGRADGLIDQLIEIVQGP